MDPPTLVPSFDFDHSSFWAPCFATFGHFSTFHGIACYHLACSRGWLQHRSKVICSRDWYILSCQSPINEHLPFERKGTKKTMKRPIQQILQILFTPLICSGLAFHWSFSILGGCLFRLQLHSKTFHRKNNQVKNFWRELIGSQLCKTEDTFLYINDTHIHFCEI